MAATASACTVVSSPANRASIGAGGSWALVTLSVPLAAATRAAASSRRPRGSASQWGSVSSKQQISRGVLKVENLWFCRR